jgi:outer membrane immunogenic protein
MLKSVASVAFVSCVAVAAFGASSAKAQDGRWAGGYAGVHLGYAWGDVDVRDTNGGVLPGPFSYDANGAFGGGTFGFNWRTQGIVLGVEADLGYMDLSGAGIIPSSAPPAHQDITLDGGFYADATVRGGFLVMPSTLVYAKGGFAYFNGEARQKTTNPGYVTHGADGFTGWVAGAGVEHFINPSLSVRAEYLHFDFGSEDGDQTNVGDSTSPPNYKFRNTTDVTADTIKVGVAWHF